MVEVTPDMGMEPFVPKAEQHFDANGVSCIGVDANVVLFNPRKGFGLIAVVEHCVAPIEGKEKGTD